MRKLIILILGVLICTKACAGFYFSLQIPKFKPSKHRDKDAWREEFEASKEKDIFYTRELIVRQNEKRYRAYQYYITCNGKCGDYKGE